MPATKTITNINTNSEVGEIADPKLRKLLLRVVREMELSIERVGANHAKPNEFPLPADLNSTEHILAARFKSLPATVKDRAGSKALESLNASPEARLKRFGDLAKVDLKTNTSVGSQVKRLPLPSGLSFTMEELTAGVTNGVTGGVSALAVNPVPAPGSKATKLELRLHKVKCVDETGSTSFGSDEIDLGGSAVDETGDTHAIAKFRVGSDFDSGEQVTFSPPRQFTRFALTEGTKFPKSYFVTMVLAEIDHGGFPDFLSKLLVKVKEKVTTLLKEVVGGVIGASGGPIGVAIGIAVGFVVGKIFDLIGRIWGDDVFPPKTVKVSIPSLNARWPGGKSDSPEGIATFIGHGGKYEVTYDWRMFA
jgi:hypothetical protein